MHGLPLVVASKSYSLVAVHGLLTAGASRRRAQVLEHRLHGLVASGHVRSSWTWD